MISNYWTCHLIFITKAVRDKNAKTEFEGLGVTVTSNEFNGTGKKKN